ncbi:MAG: zinc ABC transporter substrate-binding protein [Lentisphaeria bacterium]|nr:zinc ABC transporter substrate-binding protein [Lentisphaeria bacterium]
MLKRFVRMLLLLFATSFFAGCGGEKETGEKALISAGLPPVAWIAEQICGAPVPSALPEGRSPHDFTPHPAVIGSIAASRVFLKAGMPFEEHVADAVSRGTTRVADVSKGIRRIPMSADGEACCHEHHHHHEKNADAHAHGDSDAMDPHIWLSPANCRIIAENILQELEKADPANLEHYRENYRKLVQKLDDAERIMQEKLAPWKGRSFFVHHPAFGYYAAAAGLHQSGIELGGREPSPARLAEVIERARKHQVKTIFVQPQFNPASARALAEAIGGNAAELDPLAADVVANFARITEGIIKGFEAK